jgi:hypothetical protein
VAKLPAHPLPANRPGREHKDRYRLSGVADATRAWSGRAERATVRTGNLFNG